jgi:hypothetical protein
MCPGWTPPLKNEYQDTPAGKDGRRVRLTTYNLQVQTSRNLEPLTFQNPLGPIGLQWECFTFIFTYANRNTKAFNINFYSLIRRLGRRLRKKHAWAGLLHAERSCHLAHSRATAMRAVLAVSRGQQNGIKELNCDIGTGARRRSTRQGCTAPSHTIRLFWIARPWTSRGYLKSSSWTLETWWWPNQKRAETFSCFLQQLKNTVVLRRTFIHLISTRIWRNYDYEALVYNYLPIDTV